MSARLIEVVFGDADVPVARNLLAAHVARMWQESVPGGKEKFSCIVPRQETEDILARLSAAFSDSADFSALVVRLEAALPPLSEAEILAPDTGVPRRPPSRLERFLSRDRMSTDEIYDDIANSIGLSSSYLMTVFLSAIIAALGMKSGQTAVVIGAMVIAPLLGPTLAIAMAATVGNWRLARRSGATLIVGVLIVLGSTALLGASITFDPTTPELYNRTIVHLADVALALASGAAGVLALSNGASMSLVGVMIAVALVPPLSAAGLYAGSGEYGLSLRALFLFTTNLVCINVAGIASFLIQGLPPKRWRFTITILAIWVGLLVLLGAMITGRIVLGQDWSG